MRRTLQMLAVLGFFVAMQSGLFAADKKETGQPSGKAQVMLFPAEIGGKWGFIDKEGQLVIAPDYDATWDFSDGLARAQVGLFRGFINARGRMVIQPKYYLAWDFSEGVAAVMIPKGRFGGNVNSGSWAYIDRTGKVVLKSAGTWAESFHQGFARRKHPAGSSFTPNTFLKRNGRNHGFFNSPQDFHEGLSVVGGRKWGYFDASMKYVISPQFDAAGRFSEGLACVRKGKKWGFINKTGKFAIELQYTNARTFSKGLAAVQMDGLWGCIDKTGKMIIKPQFDFIGPFSENRARILVKKKVGYIDRTGAVVIKPTFDTGWEFSKGLARVEINGKENYIKANGSFVWDDAKRKIHEPFIKLRAEAKDETKRASAVAACIAILKSATDDYTREAGLMHLGGIAGEDAFGELHAALSDKNKRLNATAARALSLIPGEGITKKIILKFSKATGSERITLLNILGHRNDKSALPTLRTALKDKQQIARLSAFRAIVELDGVKAIPDLLVALKTGTSPEQAFAQKELGKMRSKESTAAIAEAIPTVSPAIRATLLKHLATRNAKNHAGLALAEITHADIKLRIAALHALATLGNEKHLPKIIEGIVKAKSDDERNAAEHAVGSIIGRRIRNAEAMAVASIKSFEGATSPVRCALLRVLGRLGTAKAFASVNAATKDADATVADAAVKTLAAWRGTTAAESLLAIARSSKNEAHQQLARQTFIQLLTRRAKRSAEKTIEWCKAGLEVATRQQDKNTVIDCIANVRSLDALNLLASFLENEALRDHSIKAMIRLSGQLVSAYPEKINTHILHVKEICKIEKMTKPIDDVLKNVKRYEGHITSWMVSKRFADKKIPHNKLTNTVFPPEDPKAQEVKWTVVPSKLRNWYVNLGALLGGTHCVGYLRTTVQSPVDQEAQLQLAFDDKFKVWLNGDPIPTKKPSGKFGPAQNKLKVNLKKGANVLLIKVHQFTHGWGAGARFRKPDGTALSGLTYKAE